MAEQRREVEQFAGALFEEQQALHARQRLLDEGRSVIDRTRTATEQHAAEIAKLNELLQAGAIDQATYARAVEDANDRALRPSQAWTDGATRLLKDYVAESQDAASATEQVFVLPAFAGPTSVADRRIVRDRDRDQALGRRSPLGAERRVGSVAHP